jgi:uncharacterized Ntn-hydrolase superfamily protein
VKKLMKNNHQIIRNSLATVFLFLSLLSNAQQFKMAEPLAHTFSIVARDSITGEMAVAVQSHWFSVGTVVSWAEAGVGVVATQSFVNKSFGPRGLELLKQGESPEEAVRILLSDDEGESVRQLAILDKNGHVATHTGKNCIAEAGHLNGTNFSVQANMMMNDKVVPSMKKAWLTNKNLPLAERTIAVLKAAQSTGGDIRGKQSGVLLVVKGESSNEPWNDRLVDLRVDDHENPIGEIERLLKVHRAYEHMNQGDLYVETGDMQKAMVEYEAAMKMFPQNLEMQYWTAITLATNHEVKKAVPMLQGIYKKEPNWRELTRRLPKVGLLNVSEKEYQDLIR